MIDAMRRIAAVTVMLGFTAGCGQFAASPPSEQRSIHIAVDVSESQEAAPARCAAADDLVRAEVIGLRRGSIKVTVWASGGKGQPEPELLIEERFAPTRTGKMRGRAERPAEREAFADEFENHCRARLDAVGGRDVSPIHTMIKRVAEQHAADCDALNLLGEHQCAGEPLFLIMTDLVETGGNEAMEKRLRAARRARLRPKAKITMPDVPELGLPKDARVIVCGVGATTKTTKIATEDVLVAWRTPDLLGGAVIRPRCISDEQIFTQRDNKYP